MSFFKRETAVSFSSIFKYLSFRLTYKGKQYHGASLSILHLCEYCFFCVTGIWRIYSATVTPRCRYLVPATFQNSDFVTAVFCCDLLLPMTSFGSLGRPSARIVFLVDPLYLMHLSAKFFSADSLFMSLKIDFSHIVRHREFNVGYDGLKLSVQN